MQQRITLITLGVRDLGRARAFYEALGWAGGEQPDDEVVFFQAGGMVFGLWKRERLLEEAGFPDADSGPEAVSVAHNVSSRAEVDAIIDEAERAGATIRRRPYATDWGGYSSIFTDLDGHIWEVAHNPGWRLAEDGTVSLH